MKKDVMSLKEAMEYLNFKDENCFRRNCREGKIPCRYLGGEYRFSKTALDIISWGREISPFFCLNKEIT